MTTSPTHEGLIQAHPELPVLKHRSGGYRYDYTGSEIIVTGHFEPGLFLAMANTAIRIHGWPLEQFDVLNDREAVEHVYGVRLPKCTSPQPGCHDGMHDTDPDPDTYRIVFAYPDDRPFTESTPGAAPYTIVALGD